MLVAERAGATTAPALPDKASFLAGDVTYLDSGTQHPISIAGKGGGNTVTLTTTTERPAPLSQSLVDGLLGK